MKKNVKIKLLLLLLLFLLFGFFYFLISEKGIFENELSKCELLVENCKDKSCKYYFLCFGKNYQKCSIYKCEKEFKVMGITKEGKKEIFSFPQPQKEKVEKLVNACKSSEVEILEKKCEKNTFKIKLKIKTPEICSVEAFVARKEKKYFPVEFKKEKETFLLTAKSCEIDSIVVVGTGGVKIKEVQIK